MNKDRQIYNLANSAFRLFHNRIFDAGYRNYEYFKTREMFIGQIIDMVKTEIESGTKHIHIPRKVAGLLFIEQAIK
jgi:hypothetical protein